MLYAWVENGLIFATEKETDIPDSFRDSVVVFEDISLKDIDKLYVDNNEIKLKPEEILKEEKILQIKNQLIEKVKIILNGKLSVYGYYSFGDLVFYAQAGEQEAVELLEWYRNFDMAVWNWIENELPNKTADELIEIDLKNLVEEFVNIET